MLNKGKRVVITGAGRGIGRAIAEAFAASGASLYLTGRDSGRLQELTETLRHQYPEQTFAFSPADLSLKDQVMQLGDSILAWGVPDVLVNNAGHFLPGSVHEEPEGRLEEMIAVNLYSAYHLTRQLIPSLKARKQGHIFNICSIASLQPYPNGGSYGISKYALAGFSANLREELKPHGIKVTAVFPGAVFTDSWAGFDNSAQRIMEASDIAAMLVAAAGLSATAVVEDIIIRPQLGDL